MKYGPLVQEPKVTEPKVTLTDEQREAVLKKLKERRRKALEKQKAEKKKTVNF